MANKPAVKASLARNGNPIYYGVPTLIDRASKIRNLFDNNGANTCLINLNDIEYILVIAFKDIVLFFVILSL